MNIHYLGPEGSFGHEAAAAYKDLHGLEGVLIPCGSWDEIARNVKSSDDLGFMVNFNRIDGHEQPSLDAIHDTGIFITNAVRLPIVLVAGEHPENKDHTLIYSHPKGLGQAKRWINDRYPQAQWNETSSTSAAAKHVAEAKVGIAISSRLALDIYGLQLLAEDIGNPLTHGINYTEFYVVSNKENNTSEDGKYYTRMVITPCVNYTGLLADITMFFKAFEIDLTDFRSRTSPGIEIDNNSEVPLKFFVEVACHKDHSPFKYWLSRITNQFNPDEKDVEVVSVHGSYKKSPVLEQHF